MRATIYADTLKGIASYLSVNWSATPVVGPNERYSPVVGTQFLRWGIAGRGHDRFTATGQSLTGRLYEGTVAFDFFGPSDEGLVGGTENGTPFDGLADHAGALRALLNDKAITLGDGNILHFESCFLGDESPTDDGWVSVAFDAPFYVYEAN